MMHTLRLLPKYRRIATTNAGKVINGRFQPFINKFYTTKVKETDDQITIGDVTKILKEPTNPELVPQKYGETNILNCFQEI